MVLLSLSLRQSHLWCSGLCGLSRPMETFAAHHNRIPHLSDFRGFLEISYARIDVFVQSPNRPIHLRGISYLISKRFALCFLLEHLHYLCLSHSCPFPGILHPQPGFTVAPVVTLWTFFLLPSGWSITHVADQTEHTSCYFSTVPSKNLYSSLHSIHMNGRQKNSTA